MRALLFSLALLATPALAADAAAGKAGYAVCAACHGQNGEGVQAMNAPRLSGQQDWYLTKQINAFRAGTRGAKANDVGGAQMRPMAMQLANDQAIANVVAYIGTLKSPVPAASVKGDAKKGQSLYSVCVACHGSKAEGNKALNAPRLAGMNDWYLVKQLNNFRNGVRGADPKDVTGMQMAPMAKTLANDAAVADVVAYIQTLAK